MSLQYVVDDDGQSLTQTNTTFNRAISKYTPGGGRLLFRTVVTFNQAQWTSMAAAVGIVLVPAIPNAIIVPKFLQLQMKGQAAQAPVTGTINGTAGFTAPTAFTTNVAGGAVTGFATAGNLTITYGTVANPSVPVASSQTTGTLDAGGAASFSIGAAKTQDYWSAAISMTGSGNIATPGVGLNLILTRSIAYTAGSGTTFIEATTDYEIHPYTIA